MRTFDQLNEEEQKAAEDRCLEDLVGAIVEGAVRFNDEENGDDLQARIDAAAEKSEAMETPWFAGSYILEAAEEELRGMARCDAEDALYPAASERVVRLPQELRTERDETSLVPLTERERSMAAFALHFVPLETRKENDETPFTNEDEGEFLALAERLE